MIIPGKNALKVEIVNGGKVKRNKNSQCRLSRSICVQNGLTGKLSKNAAEDDHIKVFTRRI